VLRTVTSLDQRTGLCPRRAPPLLGGIVPRLSGNVTFSVGAAANEAMVLRAIRAATDDGFAGFQAATDGFLRLSKAF